jgi:hypothetical protein
VLASADRSAVTTVEMVSSEHQNGFLTSHKISEAMRKESIEPLMPDNGRTSAFHSGNYVLLPPIINYYLVISLIDRI